MPQAQQIDDPIAARFGGVPVSAPVTDPIAAKFGGVKVEGDLSAQNAVIDKMQEDAAKPTFSQRYLEAFGITPDVIDEAKNNPTKFALKQAGQGLIAGPKAVYDYAVQAGKGFDEAKNEMTQALMKRFSGQATTAQSVANFAHGAAHGVLQSVPIVGAPAEQVISDVSQGNIGAAGGTLTALGLQGAAFHAAGAEKGSPSYDEPTTSKVAQHITNSLSPSRTNERWSPSLKSAIQSGDLASAIQDAKVKDPVSGELTNEPLKVQDRASFHEALNQRKKAFWQNEVIPRMEAAGPVLVDKGKILDSISVPESKSISAKVTPRVYENAVADQKGFYSSDYPMDIKEAQERVQDLNAQLDSFFKHPSASESVEARAPKLAAILNERQALNEQINSAVDQMTGGDVSALKKRWGNIKTIEDQAFKAKVAQEVAKTPGLAGALTPYMAGKIAAGGLLLLSGHPEAAVAVGGYGAAEIGAKSLFNKFRNPDYQIRKAVDVLQRLPKAPPPSPIIRPVPPPPPPDTSFVKGYNVPLLPEGSPPPGSRAGEIDFTHISPKRSAEAMLNKAGFERNAQGNYVRVKPTLPPNPTEPQLARPERVSPRGGKVPLTLQIPGSPESTAARASQAFTEPLPSVSGAAGEMERESPLFAGSGSTGQGGLFSPSAEPKPEMRQEGGPRLSDIRSERPSNIVTDPERFQFRTELSRTMRAALEGGQKYEPELSEGPITVWRDPGDGRLYVVDGHHRLQMAKRSGVDSVEIREINVPDAKTARAFGAYRNIASGHATPVDVAKFMRDTGKSPDELSEIGIAPSSNLMTDAAKLRNLDDPIFERVAIGRMREDIGAAIGSIADKTKQHGMLKLIERNKGEMTPGVIEALARRAQNAPVVEKGYGLFGPESESSALEAAKLEDYVRNRLSHDKRMFGYVSKGERPEELSKAGNIINVGESRKISEGAARALEAFDKLKQYQGAISDAINDGAARLRSKSGRPEDIRNEVYRHIQDAVSRELGQK